MPELFTEPRHEGASFNVPGEPATRWRPPVDRIVRFGGVEWYAKDFYTERVGPGGTMFAAENIEHDGRGRRLRLHVRATGETPTGAGGPSLAASAELQTVLPLGRGTYQADVIGDLTGDRWGRLVFGFFTFDLDASTEANDEVDIEVGTFNGAHEPGAVVSNFNTEADQIAEFAPASSGAHRLRMTIGADSIRWEVIDLTTGAHVCDESSSDSVPSLDGAVFVLNLWQFEGVDPGEAVLEVRNFSHEPEVGYTLPDLGNYLDDIEVNGGGVFLLDTPTAGVRFDVTAARMLTNVTFTVEEAADIVAVGAEDRGLNGDVILRPISPDYFTAGSLTFTDAERTSVEVTAEADQGSFTFDVPITVQAAALDVTVNGAALAPETSTFVDPIDLGDAATWIHVQVTNGADALTGCSLVGTTAGVTFAYPAAAESASFASDANLASDETDYFAVNVTGAETAGSLDFTLSCDQGEATLSVGVN